ncbi:MAG TPA: multiheme c-type cytochrome [Kofleriaceae bacterium]
MLATLVVVLALGACGDDGAAYEPERLMDPATCKDCHQDHHTQWSGSMHAYSATDPIFRAMHKRGQRDTNGELGMLCVKCHAPMAVARGTITDANVKDFDFDTLGAEDNGVTCYFCHNVEKVNGDHNNPLQLAMDSTMRGGIDDPDHPVAHSPAHHSKYDTLMDNDSLKNDASMCGSCHDIVNHMGVETERTFREWKTTVFATSPDAPVSCGSCHMKTSTGLIADGEGLDVTSRPNGFHDHKLVAIDQALVEFPEKATQDAALKEFLGGSSAIVGPKPRNAPPPGGICLPGGGTVSVRVDALIPGHNFPSGSSFDRRAWIELQVFDASNNLMYSNGVVPDGTDPEDVMPTPPRAMFFDKATKADGTEAHFIWDVAAIEPNDQSMAGSANVLMPAVTFDANSDLYDHSHTINFINIANLDMADRIEARLLVRPFAYKVLGDLVQSSDLDASFMGKVPTLEVDHSTWLRATKATGAAIGTQDCNPK